MLERLFPTHTPQLVGIDISSTKIKLMTLARNGESYSVDTYGEAALPDGAVVEKEIKDIDAVASTLKTVISSSGTKSKYAAVALGDSSVITKIIKMDAGLSDVELEEQVLLDAHKHIPYPLNEVRLDFQVIGNSKEGSRKIDVLLAASRAETVDCYVQVINHAGLIPQIVEVESFVLRKACHLFSDQLPNKGINKTVAIVDIGANRTSVVVLNNFLPVFTRGELFGGSRLKKTVANRYGMSIAEVEQAMSNNALPETYEAEILLPFKEDTLQHIRRALQFYSSSHQASEIDHLILSGGVALLPGLKECVAEQLNLTTTIADPVKNMKIESKVEAAKLTKNSSSLMLCCGLALRSFD